MILANSDFYKELLTILFYPLLDNNKFITGNLMFDFVSDDLLRENYITLLKQGEILANIHYFIDYFKQNLNLSEDKYVLKNFKTKSSLKNINKLQKMVLSYLLELLLEFIFNKSWNLRQKQKMNKLLKIFNVKFKIK